MPTGVAVSPAMNHGGPYPATGHPGFTAVGIPAAMRRFSMLHCYDNVRPDRLPPSLQDRESQRTDVALASMGAVDAGVVSCQQSAVSRRAAVGPIPVGVRCHAALSR